MRRCSRPRRGRFTPCSSSSRRGSCRASPPRTLRRARSRSSTAVPSADEYCSSVCTHAVRRHRVHLVRRCAADVGRGNGAVGGTSCFRTCSSPPACCIALFFAGAASSSVLAASVEFSDGDIDPVVAHQFPQFGSTLLLVFALRMAAIFVFATSTIARKSPSCPTGSPGAATRSVSSCCSAPRCSNGWRSSFRSGCSCSVSSCCSVRAGCRRIRDVDPGDGGAAVRTGPAAAPDVP